uniref:DNA mismatch repair protein n=1 Tax=Kalanchoe fedtschenkoi TaxID=63787 RepID=A0A7N0UGB3_KALFE
MAPSRRLSNGRSPLVNQQSQITKFFNKTTSSPSPSPSPTLSKLNPKKISPDPSPSPVPSPQRPALDNNCSNTASFTKSYGEEVLNKGIRVYWPLDQSWYQGHVKEFDAFSGKHKVCYDDGEEEELCLSKEKIQWIPEKPKNFRRLRKAVRVVVDDMGEEEKEESCRDDSAYEDWGNNAEKEVSIDKSHDIVLDDEDHSESKTEIPFTSSRKRKVCVEEMMVGSAKNSKSFRDSTASRLTSSDGKEQILTEQMNKCDYSKPSTMSENVMTVDALERFSIREKKKLWFLGDKRKDANRRRRGDLNYDPRTLSLPPDFLKGLTGGQRQWWAFKSKHMDKVIFFKMGKFYELYEMDAHVGTKELDLQYMKGDQPHCGFPEKNFSMNVEKLARKGYRVLVVEQTETPDQLEHRRKEEGSKDKVVKREACAVITKGTLTEGELLSAHPDASYLLALTETSSSSEHQCNTRTFGVCAVDVATSSIILGQFSDDRDCNVLGCLLSELRPVEIIKPAGLLSEETERVLLKQTRSPLVNELIPLSEFWDAEKTVRELKDLYKRITEFSLCGSMGASNVEADKSNLDRNGYLPDVLSGLISLGPGGSYALSALGGTIYYLKQAFLDEALLRYAKFELLPCSGVRETFQNPYMILDAAALENLEIFENSSSGDSSGTLYAQLNYCVTAFGKRLLKSWLARPLYNVYSIKERQDAIAGLRGGNQPLTVDFRKQLSKIPDMERLLARLFTTSEGNGRYANKVTLYEDSAKKQLEEFIATLRGCEVMVEACSNLGSGLENTESQLLHHLLTPGKGLPDISSTLQHFKDDFDWEEASNSGRIIPHEGADLEYDSACKLVKEIESDLRKHLREQRKLLGDPSIDYVTVGKDIYLLEVPEDMSSGIPKDFEIRSSKKGYVRYWNPYIKKLVGELSRAESEKDANLKSILQRLIYRFCEHHNKWRQLVSAVAELDVLISLAIVSDFYEGPTCRPTIMEVSASNEVPRLKAKSLGHPMLKSDSVSSRTFVPNDVTVGGPGNASFILLTGPNMGGKSTLLRQICLSVILAQVGVDVPAESFELLPVDRIFVRMGAKDNIMAGQSTFLTELSETATILSSATRNSLVALDELGRGTSTSDGQAIAEAVLNHFVQKVQCRGLFSTHYHRFSCATWDAKSRKWMEGWKKLRFCTG